MNIETVSILGIKTQDPNIRGRLYLSEEGDLTKDIRKAKLIPHDNKKLEKALMEVKAFSPNYFKEEIIPYY